LKLWLECFQKAEGEKKSFPRFLCQRTRQFCENPFLGHQRQRRCSKNCITDRRQEVKCQLQAAATIESWKIILIELDDNCDQETVFDSKTSSKTVEVLKFEVVFSLSLSECPLGILLKVGAVLEV
jgi:hypothetical protein